MSTPFHEMDLQRIAVGCLFIQSGFAEVDFPGTTPASPSEWVVVNRNVRPLPAGLQGFQHLFPFKVPWDLWQFVVVPLIRGDGQDVWAQYKDGMFDWLMAIKSWVGLLKGQLQVESFPDGEEIQLNGDPIQRGYLGDPSGYPDVDPQLAWIEGHRRIDYPEVP